MIVHLVSHTHWDREWYLTAARFRQKLVALVDELIDSPPAGGASFLLDGQMAVIEDYLAVRPERRDALARLMARGSIEAGPWYVLADELIPGGEAMVRNLLAGRRSLRALGAKAPPVLYCPDSFGHPAAMPALAAGFGFATAIALRGFGGARWPKGDFFRWQGATGEEVLLYHFSRTGYDTGANLPADAAAARERWAAIKAELGARSTLGVTLLMNGADHHARQNDLDRAVAALQEAAKDTHDDVHASSLAAFIGDAEQRASGKGLPEVSGELCDSYGTVWTLGGTLATRAHQKRRNARIERLLVRDAEPWAALASFAARRHTVATEAPAGAGGRRALINAAWHSLLLCHPHDTLCGCSTDEVARQMDARLDEADVQARGIRDDALLDVIGHRTDFARERKAEWKPVAVVRNAAARPRSGVALIRLTSFLSDVKVGANASPGPVETAGRTTPALAGVSALQVLSRADEHEMTESPRHYPDDDVVQACEVAAWVPEVPAYGVRAFEHRTRGRKGEFPNPARVEGRAMDNGRIHVDVGGDGRIKYTDAAAAGRVDDLLWWECAEDLGDEYTPSPRGMKYEPEFQNVVLKHRGPLRACFESHWKFGKGRERITLARQLVVDADARWLRIHISGENSATDHRLRLRIASGIRNAAVFADAMFGAVERKPIVVPADDAKFEKPLATAPLHRYVSLFGAEHGMTVFSDGLAEYEADAKGNVFVTLVRATGELSRGDLPERPGHAGWPSKTPEAQCIGPFGTELAVMLHGPRSAGVIDEIERAADDVLLPLTGATLRSALQVPAPVRGVELEGAGLALSAAKESDDGEWLVLRCVNLVDRQCSGSWRLPWTPTEAQLARLDETPERALVVRGDTVPFRAGPRAVVTVLVR